VQTQEVVASAVPAHPYLTLSHLPLVQGSPRSPEPHRLTFTTPRPTFTPSVLRSSKGKRWTKPTGWGPFAPPAGAASVRGTLFKGSFSRRRQIRSRAVHLYSSPSQ
jgi:hypothetical protein